MKEKDPIPTTGFDVCLDFLSFFFDQKMMKLFYLFLLNVLFFYFLNKFQFLLSFFLSFFLFLYFYSLNFSSFSLFFHSFFESFFELILKNKIKKDYNTLKIFQEKKFHNLNHLIDRNNNYHKKYKQRHSILFYVKDYWNLDESVGIEIERFIDLIIRDFINPWYKLGIYL